MVTARCFPAARQCLAFAYITSSGRLYPGGRGPAMPRGKNGRPEHATRDSPEELDPVHSANQFLLPNMLLMLKKKG